MKILALDSTAVVASAAVCDDEKLIALYTVNNGNTHSETLLPMVEAVMKHSKTEMDEIGLFVSSNGPGSFTGVRIGSATVKGLAFDRNVPCIDVSTLEALAFNLRGFNGILCPVMNARRNQVYNALFRWADGTLIRLTPDRAISIEELQEELVSIGEPVYLSGDGYDITCKGFDRITPEFTPEVLRHQNAYSVARCGLAAYKRGEAKTDLTIAPTYLRPSQAERERNEKEAKK
jgi:tRNA threonylcarbamoyladenosine biosynthesis protein TsaB